MKIKTQDLIGAPLDWAVAKCEGYGCQFDDEVSGPWLVPQEGYLHDEKPLSVFRPSTSGSEVIDIMEREGIDIEYMPNFNAWSASLVIEGALGQDRESYSDDQDRDSYSVEDTEQESFCGYGPTLRIAVCRCYVASKLGDEIDVPEELMK